MQEHFAGQIGYWDSRATPLVKMKFKEKFIALCCLISRLHLSNLHKFSRQRIFFKADNTQVRIVSNNSNYEYANG